MVKILDYLTYMVINMHVDSIDLSTEYIQILIFVIADLYVRSRRRVNGR